jgi:hypothetical protein
MCIDKPCYTRLTWNLHKDGPYVLTSHLHIFDTKLKHIWIIYNQTKILESATRNMQVHMFYSFKLTKIKDGKTSSVPSNTIKFGGLKRQLHPNEPKYIIL